jgi:phosphoglycerol transferase MdoB-like AlkP superfamily enzyme
MEKYFGEGVPYSGNSAVILGVVLLIIAGVFALFGFKIENSLRVKRPGKAIAGVLVAVWILSILTFLVNVGVYSILLQ